MEQTQAGRVKRFDGVVAVDGVAVDADTLEISVLDPTGTPLTGFPVETGIVHSGTGLYLYDWTVPSGSTAGVYLAMWEGTAGGVDVVGFDAVSVVASGAAMYSPPTFTTILAKIALDLSDSSKSVFTDARITEYVRDAIGEMASFRVIPDVVTITTSAGLSDPLGLDFVWKVEAVDTADSGYGITIFAPDQGQGGRYAWGWKYYGGTLYLPPALVANLTDALDEARVTVRVWGYRSRNMPSLGSDLMDLSSNEDEMLLTTFCRLRGYEALNADRALFQQWQTLPSNTDTSETQLLNLLQVAQGNWNRERKRFFQPKHPPVGA